MALLWAYHQKKGGQCQPFPWHKKKLTTIVRRTLKYKEIATQNITASTSCGPSFIHTQWKLIKYWMLRIDRGPLHVL